MKIPVGPTVFYLCFSFFSAQTHAEGVDPRSYLKINKIAAAVYADVENLKFKTVVFVNSKESKPFFAVITKSDEENFEQDYQFAVNELNNQIAKRAPKGVFPTEVNVLKESEIYEKSTDAYLTVILTADVMGRKGKKISKRFILPVERMILDVKPNLGYWTRHEVRIVDDEKIAFPYSF